VCRMHLLSTMQCQGRVNIFLCKLSWRLFSNSVRRLSRGAEELNCGGVSLSEQHDEQELSQYVHLSYSQSHSVCVSLWSNLLTLFEKCNSHERIHPALLLALYLPLYSISHTLSLLHSISQYIPLISLYLFPFTVHSLTFVSAK
jgi:hypothetical protein